MQVLASGSSGTTPRLARAVTWDGTPGGPRSREICTDSMEEPGLARGEAELGPSRRFLEPGLALKVFSGASWHGPAREGPGKSGVT